MVISPGGSAAALIAALVVPNTGLTVNSLTVSGHIGAGGLHPAIPGPSWGTYTNASNVYGIGSGVILSTGKVADYGDGPNVSSHNTTNFNSAATAPQAALLAQIGGAGNYFDVTQIDVAFTLVGTRDTLFFNVVFGSEEWPDFVGFDFIDSFGLFVNGVNIAFSGGLPIDINHPSFADIRGTELNGVLAPGGIPLLQFSKVVGAGSSGTLTIILGDKSDGNYDTTVYVNALSGGAPLPQSAVITMYGWKLFPDDPCGEPEEVKEIPPVKQAV